MATRQHSRFVHFVLPWLVAASGLTVFLLSLHPWVSFQSLDIAARVAEWEWNTMQLAPVTLIVTWPIRWLPDTWAPVALNVLSAILGAATLGLLAKSVALLPHDRTRDQRQRERSDFSFLTVPMAWVPPAAASAMLAFQLTFWEHATSMTGEMVDVFLFAFCVYCFLRFRVLQEDKYLALLAFAFGAAAANDWGTVGFAPLFLIAIFWAKGVAFFSSRFLLRTGAALVAGLLFYLVAPAALLVTGQGDGSFLELLRTTLSFQREYIMNFPRWALLFCGAASILPVTFMGIRWPSTFSDLSAAGSAMTNLLFRIIHLAFLGFCAWAMFDPPFSPRARGFGFPFLHFYFLTALAIGYMLGYVILVFGQEPERRLQRTSGAMLALSRGISSLAMLAALGAGAGLLIYNWPAIRGQNGPLVRDLADTLLPPDPENPVFISDDPILLTLAVGRFRELHPGKEVIPINTLLLRRQVYQRHHELKYGARWPALALENLTDPIADDTLIRQMGRLTVSNQLFYLHPSFGYYFEVFRPIPSNYVYYLQLSTTNLYEVPPIPDEQFEQVHEGWTALRKKLADSGLIESLLAQRVSDARIAGVHYSRAMNTWGVTLQRRNRLEDAAVFFESAVRLNKDNTAASINRTYNSNLRAGRREGVDEQIGGFRDLTSFLRLCGPVDEPSFCFRLGRVFNEGNLFRQAARSFARALELQPGLLDARLWLANATLKAGFPKDALEVIRNVRDTHANLTPDQLTDLITLESWALYYGGDFDAAEEILLNAQRQFPDRLEPLQTLNDIYFSANRTNAALKTVEKLIERMPGNPRPVITKSAILIHAGRYEDAVETLSALLENRPDFFPALVNRALAYSRLKMLNEAERDYRRLLEIAPGFNIVYYHLGEIDYQRGDVVAARRHYRKFLASAVSGSPEARAAERRLQEMADGRIVD